MWVPCSSRRSRSSERQSVVVLLIDDAHWADVDSLRALLFALRRLVGRPRADRSSPCGTRTRCGCPTASAGWRAARQGERISLEALESGEHPDAGDGARCTAVPPADRAAAARPHRWQPAVRAGAAVRAPGRSVAHLAAARSRRRVPSPARSSSRLVGVQPAGEMRWSRPARSWVSAPRCRWRAALAQLDDPVGALEEAVAVGLLQSHRQGRHLGRRVPASAGAGGRLRAREPDEPDPAASRSVRVGRRRRCRAAPPGRRHHAARRRGRRPPSMPSPGERCAGAPGRARLPRSSRPAG